MITSGTIMKTQGSIGWRMAATLLGRACDQKTRIGEARSRRVRSLFIRRASVGKSVA
jgi:hypothetical protein